MFLYNAHNIITIYNNINLSLERDIKIVIEPFCGSCSLSYYIWTKLPNLKFILNDNNETNIINNLESENYLIYNQGESDKYVKNSSNVKIILRYKL